MTPLTLEQLVAVAPATARVRLEIFVEPLEATFTEFSIDSEARRAAFLAQVGHESGGFRYLRELADGKAYEGNAHLGNTVAGDGPRYKGRGLIQITGRKNYTLLAGALGLPLLQHPEVLEDPVNGCRSAGWFWTTGAGLNLSKRAIAYGVPAGCNLNELADRGDFEGITLAINGGLNGQDDRLAYFERAQVALA